MNFYILMIFMLKEGTIFIFMKMLKDNLKQINTHIINVKM